ncbi:Phosphoadenylyl-sulfate reductase (thioredoxin) [Methylophaga frappieri]|jgi:phosphoadenosine phosphosulfate reductase|uniref:Phosphoadenylyl-sulfate reductase (Thioredoxin) n=1 Tax=Methylophaga frappieri (strain ATCC BAA-2434 / DSM 25690 / JAM7) TaxID=754477 RepID=I1YH46_METFJ|nr:phosphoadenosine phosphosulfate reductase family protein [Methylophaga frappieri]AFJ02239.1 Phosphoadenylyl-sulfate reductase (thioredoxin) [Methylophaga frappieri]
MIDIASANKELADATPQEIIEWSLGKASKPLISTHFGPHEAVILHMVSQIQTGVKVIWVDSGYNTRQTYLVAEKLIESLQLDIEVYTPTMTSMRWDCAHGGIPEVDDERHERFTQLFKLEPFARAMQDQSPDVWLTAVRSEQTEFRQNMGIFGNGPDGVIKVAPLLHWKEADMDAYLQKHDLPNVTNYFDPTKGLNNRECGLHTQL